MNELYSELIKVQSQAREASMTFIALVEALVLSSMRKSGVAMQRIRPALDVLQREIGIEHALASRRLYTDGAEILYDYAEKQEGSPEAKLADELTVLRSGQRVFKEVIDEYLKLITYADDEYASIIVVPIYNKAKVIVDPTRSFGAPIFADGAAPVANALERFWSGESLQEVADDFGIPVDHLEDVVRVAS